MAFCTKCGAKIPDGKKFCTECGNPVTGGMPPAPAQPQAVHTAATAVAAPPMPPPVQTAPPVQQIVYAQAGEQPPPQGSPFAVMSVGGFIGSSILMAIPVIGWIFCIVWACGGCRNHNRRNFARATLIFVAIGVALGLIAYLLLWSFIGSIFGGFYWF